MKKMKTKMETEIVMDDDAELAALEAALEAELSGDAETSIEADDATMEAAIEEVELDEAKAEAYKEQEASEDDMSTAPIVTKEAKVKAKRVPRKTMAGAKKSDVAFDKLGDKADQFVLEVSDATMSAKDQAKKRDSFIVGIDSLAIKVGEKAVNLVAYASSGAKLSAYTEIAMKFLVEKGEIIAKDLIEHLQSQEANGVKSYTVGTARSQAHQMFKLLPEFKIANLVGKVMTPNEDSLILAKFKS